MKIQEKSKFLKYSIKRYKQKRSKKTWNGIPAFLKNLEPEFSLRNHFFMSMGGHTAGLILLCVLVFVFKIGVINPIMHNQDKIKDIEFTIDSGKRIPSPKTTVYEASAPAKTEVTQKTETINSTKEAVKSLSKVLKNAKATGHVPKASKTPIGEFELPVPTTGKAAGGRGRLSRRSGDYSGGSSHGASSPFADDDGGANASSSSNGSGGFDKNATRKAISSYDISPYVNELKRNIRWNWKAPKESGKTVELFLRIAKDGKVVILNVKRTSEIGAVDNAALEAVRKTIPLNPLPSKYPKSYLDVVFTFNSNSSTMGSRF